MHISDFLPSFDDLMKGGPRVLWGRGDIWQEGADGVPHRRIDIFGNLPTIILPDSIPVKYKNRKATSAVIRCDAAGTVTGIEVHHGSPLADGYAVAYRPDGWTPEDVTDFYRKPRSRRRKRPA